MEVQTAAAYSASLGPWRAVIPLVEVLNAGSRRPTFTVPAIRNYLAHRDKNGLAPYVRKLGAKLLISEPGFVHWLEQHYSTDSKAA